MPIYRYKAYKDGGAGVAGTIEAEGARDASRKVRELGLHPSEITQYDRAGKLRLLRRSEKAGLSAYTRQLSVLLKAGVPLVEALRALEGESGGHMKGILVELREKVQTGAGLSRAMEDHGGIFPEFYRSLVAAGESSGSLDVVLDDLADFLESQEALREKLKAALIYPLIMASVGTVVLVFLFTFVIPKIVSIFENTQTALPLATVVLIWISNFFAGYWWLLAAAAAALALGYGKLRRRYSVSIDRVALRLPLRSIYLARFTRTLCILLQSGIPMLKALELSGRASGNAWLREMVREASMKVSEGARLSASLSGLPPVLLQLLATGEKSGRLTETLRSAADTYESDFDRRTQRAMALVEPVMILAMGIVVGFIALSVLLPMFQLNQLIK